MNEVEANKVAAAALRERDCVSAVVMPDYSRYAGFYCVLCTLVCGSEVYLYDRSDKF